MWGEGKKREKKARQRESEAARKRGAGVGVTRARGSYAEVHEEGSGFSDLPILDFLGAVFQPVPVGPGKA